jgi:ABC-type sugar transport system permease subunit
MLLGLGIALILADERIRFGRLWRLIVIVPVVADWVATGLVFQLIFLPNQGVLAALGPRWASTSSCACAGPPAPTWHPSR